MPLVLGGLACCAVAALPVWGAGRAIEAMAAEPVRIAAPLLALWAVAALAIVATLGAHPHPRFGPANALTTLRAAGTVALAGLVLDPGALGAAGRWIPVGLALALLAADGIDGALARRSGLASRYGARFDMEVDAALTLVLSAIAWRSGHAGAEIVLLIAPYYAFRVLRPALPWLGGALGPSRARKAICVVQVATPIACIALAPPGPAARALVLAALGAILWSFGRDVLALRAQRG